MKCITVIMMALIGVCYGQNRPFYAPRPHQYPTLLSRFGDPEGDLGNRVGEGDSPTPRPITPIGGSVVDQDLINRVATWPVDKQPFWFVNRQHIQSHIQNPPNFNLPPPQSSFISGKR